MKNLSKSERIWTIFKDEYGASAVEFALVIMPLMYVFAGIMNFAYAFFAWNTFNDAMISNNRAFAHGQIDRWEAQRETQETFRNIAGNGSAIIIADSEESVMYAWFDTKGLTLIDLPFASLNSFVPRKVFRNTTPRYNTNPYQT